jgi:hypothetical protein
MRRCKDNPNHEVIGTASFCGECGAPLVASNACPKGHANPDRHKFCYICGERIGYEQKGDRQ